MKQDFSLKAIANAIFDRWICDKTKASDNVMSTAEAHDAFNKMMCIRATNPFTGETKFMKVKSLNGVPENELSWIMYDPEKMYDMNEPHSTFRHICEEIIIPLFGISIEENDDYMFGDVYDVRIRRCRQLMDFIIANEKEITNACRKENYVKGEYMPVGIFGSCMLINEKSFDSWFDNHVLPVMRDAELKGDEYINTTLEAYNYDFDVSNVSDYFNDMLSVLTRFFWKFFNTEIVKYTDYFETRSVTESDAVSIRNPYKFIKEKCTDAEMLKNAVCNCACNRCSQESTFKSYADMFDHDCKDLETGLMIIRYWPSAVQYCLGKEIQRLLEY